VQALRDAPEVPEGKSHMTTTTSDVRTSRQIREHLDHPVIDVDGHLVEYLPPLRDYVKQIGGSKFELRILDEHHPIDPAGEALKQTRAPGVWWPLPTKNTLDRATSALPKLLHERLDEIGLDFTVLFNTTMPRVEVHRAGQRGESDYRSNRDPEVEQIKTRAFNAFRADLCRDYADRMTPAASIPMNTPEIAIEELEYAIQVLGLKAVTIRSLRRPLPSLEKSHPELFPSIFWLDSFGLDSPYNYDPFWAKCVELQVPILCHGGSFGWTGRNSPTNAVYNHIGHSADGNEALCKSLFLGGVTRRFPALRVAFLECGVAWAYRVYCDLIDRWHKRNKNAIQNYNPALLDRELFVDLHRRYGDARVQTYLSEVLEVSTSVHSPVATPPDDFGLAGIESPEEIRDLFIPNFFFGCEADDPTNALAFDDARLPFGVHLNAVLSSDIGHWDVPDMSKVIVEAYEQVETGRLSREDLRAMTFTNAVDLLAGANPTFFAGTVVEDAVEKERDGSAHAQST
jgi:predicted TIM-barrel fold metal-dependent hydrolase